jgi:hypothetical protein
MFPVHRQPPSIPHGAWADGCWFTMADMSACKNLDKTLLVTWWSSRCHMDDIACTLKWDYVTHHCTIHLETSYEVVVDEPQPKLMILAHQSEYPPNELSMKEGSLFCFVVMRSTELGCFRSYSWCLWKALNEKGCMGLVPWHLDLRCKSSWILNDF